MQKQTVRICSFFCGILLLTACTALHSGQTDADGTDPAVKELVQTTRSWDGELLPPYPPGQPEITILQIRIPAGARLEPHYHPVINAGVLTAGELTVITENGKTLHLKAGDAIVEVVNTMHYGINEGDVPAEIIVFYAGLADSPITALKP